MVCPGNNSHESQSVSVSLSQSLSQSKSGNSIPIAIALAGIAILCGVTLLAFKSREWGGALFLSASAAPGEKMCGVNLEAPRRPDQGEWIAPLQAVNARWIAVIPYAYSRNGEPRVHYNADPNTRGWWGEKPVGVATVSAQARAAGLKVLLKPHLWIRPGWAGDFDLETAEQWEQWEIGYREYLKPLLQVAIEQRIEAICLGTELRHSFAKRPQFWRGLIAEVRAQYPGELTLAANWDCFEEVTFWDQLDYLGINAYFPLSEEAQPATDTLIAGWQPIKQRLRQFSKKWDKPVLFTEYGWLAVDQAAWNHWEKEHNLRELELNLGNQSAAYAAFFEGLWSEKWFAGGFLWEWQPSHERAGGPQNKNYTPQNKPAERVVRKYYGQTSLFDMH